jgi:hypothetical protein
LSPTTVLLSCHIDPASTGDHESGKIRVETAESGWISPTVWDGWMTRKAWTRWLSISPPR